VVHHVSHGVGHGIAPDGLAFATAFIERVIR
jgi:phospholipase/carboxylesterase